MITRKNLDPKLIIFYSWKSLLYFLFIAITVYVLDQFSSLKMSLEIPFYTIAAFSTALSIFLGFNNNQAYDRWWEARKIWGLAVNYSRAWARQVTTLITSDDPSEAKELKAFQERLVYRHAAFVHALRVFLRKKHDYAPDIAEYKEAENDYVSTKPLLGEHEFKVFCQMDNPPNYLNQLQGEDLKRAAKKGWLTEYRHVQMDQTLVEFNNIQGRAERIKNTPMPRPYTYFSTLFVFIHATLLPFAFVSELGWVMIPVSFIISFVFLCLDRIGERTEDPFENRIDDTPMTALSETIERNVREMYGERTFPEKTEWTEGYVF